MVENNQSIIRPNYLKILVGTPGFPTQPQGSNNSTGPFTVRTGENQPDFSDSGIYYSSPKTKANIAYFRRNNPQSFVICDAFQIVSGEVMT